MQVEIKVPEVGESITEGTLVAWFKEDGAVVAAGEPLFELETDKITVTVQAPQAGRVALLAAADSTVQIGQVVATVETDGAVAGALAPAAASPAAQVVSPIAPKSGPQAAAAKLNHETLDELAPSVRRLVAEHGIDPAAITGSGKGGRLIKEDVLAALASREAKPREEAPAPEAPAHDSAPKSVLTVVPGDAPAVKPGSQATPGPAADRAPTTRIKMSRIRQRIAERLLEAQQSAAILTTFNEVDMSRVIALRTQFREPFEQAHGVRLGFMSFFVKAAVEALKAVPMINAAIDGDEIVMHQRYDIGVAVSTEHGLVVPVLRDAAALDFAAIELSIAEFATKARERRLELSDLAGGTFTISNGGVYGSLLSTPILNPPQSGILGLHGIKQRAVVVDDAVVIRPMMYLALSYDHRLVDGKEAVTFLRRVIECIENPERMMFAI